MMVQLTGQLTVQQELDRIAKAGGGVLHPEEVVEAARPVASPLHGAFTWDNTEAAKQYRLWQARQLIRVYVAIEPHTGKRERVYVSLSSDRCEGGGYRALVDVMGDSAMRAALLEEAKQDMILFRQKYARLSELAAVFSSMEKVVDFEAVKARGGSLRSERSGMKSMARQ